MADTWPPSVVVEHRGFKLGREERLVRDTLLAAGHSCSLVALTHVQRQRVRLEPATVCVGTIPFVQAALRQHGRALPRPDSYPLPLRAFLCREVWQDRLAAVLARLENGGPALFMKPAARHKGFSGFVIQDAADYRVAPLSHSQRVWCCAPLTWLSEWRGYVVNGDLFHLSHYAGRADCQPDPGVLREALSHYTAHGAPAGYTLDFGVLEDGRTALVEANDGFSIGAYGDVPARDYLRLLAARWQELLASSL